MIARLLRTVGTMAVYFCVGTLISQAVIAGYLWITWGVDRGKIVQILAVARGIDLVKMEEEARLQTEQAAPEEVSYEQILQARAVEVRHLELREEALGNGLEQLAFEQRKLAEENARYTQLKTAFEAEVASLDKGSKAQGLEENRRTLETIKPKQAKEQLLLMLDKQELDKVVVLLAAMPAAKRARIVGEFKTAEEAEKLSEILRKIREGIPQAAIAEQTQEKLQPLNTTGS